MTTDTTPETLADLPGFTEAAERIETAATDARERATWGAELLAILDTWADPPASYLAKLPKPKQKDAQKGRCDECGGWHGLPAVHLDYMGHADVTEALIRLDPWWNWEPAAIDPTTGGPAIKVEGNRLVMWGRLTLRGVTRLGVGTCPKGKDDPEKELIGDMLRNAAMRFGIAVRLWSKADHLDTQTPEDTPPPPPPAGLNAAKVKGRMAAELGRELAAEWWAETYPDGTAVPTSWTVDEAEHLVELACSWAIATPERAARLPEPPADADGAPTGATPAEVVALTELAADARGQAHALRVARGIAGNAGYPVPSSWDDLVAGPAELIRATTAEMTEATR